MNRLLVLVLLAGVVASAPLGIGDAGIGAPSGKPAGTATDYNASFDDLNPGAMPVAGSQGEIGPYDGLEYQAIAVIANGVAGTVIAGVNSNSPPNVAAYSSLNAGAVNGDGTVPTITTQYVGSVTDRFDIKSFYFGCVLNLQDSAASTPAPCTITVTGYKATEKIAKQEFSFDSETLDIVADMVYADLKGFDDIDTAVFETKAGGLLSILGGAGDLLVGTLLDNLVYTTYNAEPSSPSTGNLEDR